MLHSEAVPPGTLALLKNLCAHHALDGFALVDGTSLALRFGHRMSVDLDFFRPEKFDNKVIAAALAEDFPSFQLTNDNSNGMMAFIEKVKVDFVTYRYPLLHPYDTIENVRMMSLPDVVAMKLGAISNRGAKKDFYDLHWLCQNMEFVHSPLRLAIRSTFERRGTALPKATPVALTQEFAADTMKLAQWNAFLRKNRLEAGTLAEVIDRLRDFLQPVLFPPVAAAAQVWKPGHGWITSGPA